MAIWERTLPIVLNKIRRAFSILLTPFSPAPRLVIIGYLHIQKMAKENQHHLPNQVLGDKDKDMLWGTTDFFGTIFMKMTMIVMMI